ncbi:MAG TPA: prenyltransferase [Polyangiaceae bacterium]|nr:prenyltransferase [Polyangiaceae bacterium]
MRGAPEDVPTSMLLTRVGAFVRLGRPIFLVGGFAFYGLGAAMAALRVPSIDWRLFFWGQLAVTSIQLMTHYANDYFDLEADRANTTPTQWSGGSRVLPNGELSPSVALAAALVFAGMGLFSTFTLGAFFSAPLSVCLLLVGALLLAWVYSAPPVSLHSRGLGELDTAVIMTLLLPLAGYGLQAGAIDVWAIATVTPLFFLQFAMILAVEFPDELGDAAVGKRTLVVRMGANRAGLLYALTLMLPYISLLALTKVGMPTAAALAFLALSPLAGYLVFTVARGGHFDSRSWNRIAFLTTALLVASALLELGAFLTLGRRA